MNYILNSKKVKFINSYDGRVHFMDSSNNYSSMEIKEFYSKAKEIKETKINVIKELETPIKVEVIKPEIKKEKPKRKYEKKLKEIPIKVEKEISVKVEEKIVTKKEKSKDNIVFSNENDPYKDYL